MLLNSGVYLSS